MDELKSTLRELYIGIAVCVTVFAGVGCFLVSNSMAWLFGTLLGGAAAVCMAGHMAHSVERAVDMEKKAAAGYTKRSAVLRMIIMVLAVLLAVLLPHYFNVAGVAFGILSLKFAAFLQPLVHKFSSKILRKGR